MISIHTKYIGATDKRGSRIKAYTYDKRSVTIPLDHSLEQVERHYKAVLAFIEKHLDLPEGFADDMVYGSGHDDKGYVFCFSQSKVKGN